MKVVYNIAGTFNSGGMERVLANKANYLAGLGYDLTIVTTDQAGRRPYFELDARISQIDLGINYGESTKNNLFQKVVCYFQKQKKHRRRLTEYLRKEKADIVISMFDHEASFLYKIKDGSKKILEIHFSRFKRLQYNRKGILGRIDTYRSKQDLHIAQKYDRFVVLTEEDKTYWKDLENIQVIPNANSFVPSRTADLGEKRVIAVGRYDFQKGFEDLIKAWKIVKEKQPHWILSIFGRGPLELELKDLISDLGLEKEVQLCPPVKEIEKEYLKSSILAMTSRYEGLPMVLLEAQACGLPLVAYACKCGPKDIIEQGINGFLIEEGDIQIFAEKLLLLIQEPDLRTQMGQESQINSQKFEESVIMTQWEDLFKKLIQK